MASVGADGASAVAVGTGSDTLSTKWARRITIRIRVHSVRAVTQDYDPRHPPDGIHAKLYHHHLDDDHHSLRVQGLTPDQLPGKIVVAFTTAHETHSSAPLDDDNPDLTDDSADGEYTPRRGQDLIVTKRWMRRLACTTKHHNWHAALSSLTVREARRGGADLASCTFDLSEMVPRSGYAVIGPEHFNMGQHWRLCASVELIVPGEPEPSELGVWQNRGHHMVRVEDAPELRQPDPGEDEESLYVDSEDEGDILHNDSPAGSVADTELELWDDGSVSSITSGTGADADAAHWQFEPQPQPEPECESVYRPRLQTRLRAGTSDLPAAGALGPTSAASGSRGAAASRYE
jgi:hypothetical protein